jgi:FMN phosphatase YigB (HAD superfamily)
VVGVRKPAPPIYQDALARAGVKAGDAVFVGHAAHELDGARNAGMTTAAVFYEPSVRADYYLVSLRDLLTIPPLMVN